jgi:hypothetical protein
MPPKPNPQSQRTAAQRPCSRSIKLNQNIKNEKYIFIVQLLVCSLNLLAQKPFIKHTDYIEVKGRTFTLDVSGEEEKKGGTTVSFLVRLYRFKVPKDKKLTLTVYNFSGADYSVYYDPARQRPIDQKKPSIRYLDNFRSVYYLHNFDEPEEWVYIYFSDYSTKNIQVFLDFNLTEIDEFPSNQMDKKVYFKNNKYSWNKIYFFEKDPVHNYYFKFIYLPESLGLMLANHHAPEDLIMWKFDKQIPINQDQLIHGNEVKIQLVTNDRKSVYFLIGSCFFGKLKGKVNLYKASPAYESQKGFYYETEFVKSYNFDNNGEIMN